MAKAGYDVTVFEALHEIGGVLKYGIPEFRLPNKIVDVEISNLEKIGVKFVKDCVVGKTITVEELEKQGFQGIFVGSGAGLPNFMGIPGENSNGIMSSNERVFIAYRRSEAEMPARLEEVKHAKEEGIEFLTLHNPTEYHADEKGNVTEVVLQKMELGEPDASGRRSPVPVEGAIETIDIDMAVVAVGVSPNPLVPTSVEGLELGRKNTIAVDQAIVAVGVSPNPIVPTSIHGLELGRKNTIVVNDGMQTNIPMIFAGGDIVRGGATVILAMGDGRRAAAAMDEYLSK